LIAKISFLLVSIYRKRLEKIKVSIDVIEFSTEVQDPSVLQEIGKAVVEDVQMMINVVWDSTAFFYRRCISLESEAFCEAMIETATSMIFQAHGGAIFNIIRSLYVA